MQSIATQLYAKMCEQISALHSCNTLERAESSYIIVKATINELDEFMKTYIFQDEEEEIKFHKNIRPEFQTELFYYTRLYAIEKYKPQKDDKATQNYYKDVLKQHNQYFEQNRTLFTYCQSGQTYRDHVLFVKTPRPDAYITGSTIERDYLEKEGPSTIKANLEAIKQLNGYILRQIEVLKHPQTHGDLDGAPLLKWTATKAGLIELGYALDAAKVFNGGDSTLKTVMQTLEIAFGVNLRDHLIVIQQNIRIRQDRTKFLDRLKECVLSRMDDSDLNPRFH